MQVGHARLEGRLCCKPDRVIIDWLHAEVVGLAVASGLQKPTLHGGSRRMPLVGADLKRCIYCNGTGIAREGRRIKKHETVQLWYCKHCDRVFTPQRAKGKQFPLRVILDAVVAYYRGETRAAVSDHIKARFGIAVPARTLSSWLAEYRGLTTYARLRAECSQLYSPQRVIRSVRLHHQQTYDYRLHRGKLHAITSATQHRHLAPLSVFLESMATQCPHSLFASDARASQGSAAFDIDAVEIRGTRNMACRVADLVLQAVTNNKRRHDELQRFMLATDSVTVAVEVPIYLTAADIEVLGQRRNLRIPLAPTQTITGHIDFLQIRNGAIHILDYKPGARLERPIPQLMTYALALAHRTGLKLYDFVCAWFDEDNYYEFYPRLVAKQRR